MSYNLGYKNEKIPGMTCRFDLDMICWLKIWSLNLNARRVGMTNK
jgi:hypothetical protein